MVDCNAFGSTCVAEIEGSASPSQSSVKARHEKSIRIIIVSSICMLRIVKIIY